MPKCKVDYSKASNEEAKKKHLSVYEKQRELFTNRKTDTEIAEGFFQNVKGFLKGTSIGKFFSHMMGERAATYDFVNDLSVNKQRSMIREVIRQRKRAYSYIDGNEDAKELFSRYKSTRLTLSTARRVLEENEGIDVPKDAVEKIHMYSEYANEIKKQTGKVPTLSEFIDYVKAEKADMDKIITSSEDLLNVHKAMNELFSVQTDKIRKLNPELFADLAGEYTSHDELIDNMMVKLGANRTAVAQKFYKRIMGVEFGGVVESPDMMDLVALHMMNHFTKSLEFSEFLKKDKVASEEIKKILEEGKSDIIGEKTGVINFDYIDKLDDNSKLKIKLKRLIDSSATNIENVEGMAAAMENAKNGDFSDFFREIKRNNLKLFNKNLRLIDDTNINTFIKNNKESLPNLYKAVTNNTSFDVEAAMNEVDTVYKASDTDKSIRKNMIFKIHEDNANIEAMKKLITIEKIGNAEEAVKRLTEKFGDYSFTTRTGTKIFGDGIRIENIRNNRELLGDLSELINPGLIFKDAMTIKEIQDRKYEALVEKLVNGDVILLKKENADTISDIKRDLNNFGADGAIAGISRVFSMTTLFNPLMYPGYALTTQIFGNIGHTMMADPTAFKHWPKFIKEMKKAWQGDFESIEDPDTREIVRLLMTTEGSSLHGVALEDWDSPELIEITKQLEEKEMQNPNKKNSAKIIKFLRDKMLIDKTTKVASIIETVSRGAMAYEVLAKKKAGKVFMPPTANKHRTEHLWDYNDHLAAVRVANDTHIDYSALPPAVRRWSAMFPFMSFKVGSTFNMMRMFQNMFVETTNAMRTGNWKTAGSHMYRGAIGLAWRAGVAATLWNAVMVAIGAYKEGDRKRNNGFLSSSVFNKLFGSFGLNLDNHIYLPGTGFKPFDAVFRIGKANQKWDVMQAAEGFVPGTDRWQKAWKKDGALMGTVNASLGNVAASSNPLVKTSFEMLMGGGTIYEDGYHAKDSRITGAENIITKVAGFAGLGSLASASVREIEGIDSTYKNEAAYDIDDFKREIDDRKRSPAKDEEYQARKLIQTSISHMNTAMTLEYMRAYQHAYEKENEEIKARGGHVMSEREIKHKVEDAVRRSTLEYKAKHDRDWVKSLSPDRFRKLQQSIEQEKIFLNSLGFGRW